MVIMMIMMMLVVAVVMMMMMMIMVFDTHMGMNVKSIRYPAYFLYK